MVHRVGGMRFYIRKGTVCRVICVGREGWVGRQVTSDREWVLVIFFLLFIAEWKTMDGG